MILTLKEIAACIGAEAPQMGRNTAITGAAIDSREVLSGQLFVCLPGEKTDGHAFAAMAEERGCAAIIASRPLPEVSVPVFVVPDPSLALARLAACWRQRSGAEVVAITGTAGKTTLKDTLAAIMARKGSVAATKGNHNNQLGLPLTILNASGDEDFWILELGISHAGDMEFLGNIARPDLAVILNVGPGHTEGLGGKGVAWHKSRLLNFLASGGIGLINGDIPELVSACEDTGARIMKFGRSCDFPFQLLDAAPHGQKVSLEGEEMSFSTPFTGSSGAENAVAAAAAAHLLGADAEQIAEGFAYVQLPSHRFAHVQVGAAHIFDDTYNANPLSMKCMLESAAAFARTHHLPLYLLLGEMGELGQDAPQWHYELGKQIAALAPKALFWKGRYGQETARGLVDCHCPLSLRPVTAYFASAFVQAAGDDVKTGLVLLAKGSRVNRLENELEALQQLLGGSHAV